MKITFGLYLDGYHSLTLEDKLGEIIVGPKGFLQVLETRMGLGGSLSLPSQRIIQYLHCLKKVDDGNRFYSKSLGIDEFNVASMLLSWRDEWIVAGWDGICFDSDSQRIKDLSLVENVAKKHLDLGEADRIQKVLQGMVYHKPYFEKILCVDSRDVLPKCFQEILDALSVEYLSIDDKLRENLESVGTDLDRLQESLIKGKRTSFRNDGSLIVLTGDSEETLARGVAEMMSAHQELKTTIVLGEHSDPLNEAFENLDRPLISVSEKSCFRPHLQLLPLVLNQFWNPLDPYTLLEFLSHSISPIPAFIRYKLARVVVESPGIGGDEWQKKVMSLKEEIVKKYPSYSPNSLDEFLKDWIYVERFDRKVGAKIFILIEQCKKLSSWCASKAHSDADNDQSQNLLMSIKARVDTALEALGEISNTGKEKLTKLELDRLLKEVLSHGNSLPDVFAQVDRVYSVLYPGAVIEKTDSVFWWDFTASITYKRWSWSNNEIKQLRDHGCELKDVSNLLDYDSKMWLRPIFAAKKQLILCIPRFRYGEDLLHHPLWDNIQVLDKQNSLSVIDMNEIVSKEVLFDKFNLSEVSLRGLPEKRRWWKLPDGEYLNKRDIESYSSLDYFIKSPYHWVLKYKAKLDSDWMANLSEGSRLKGNISHRLFQLYFEGDDQWKKASEYEVNTWVDNVYYDFLQKEGATFLLDGMKTEAEDLRGKIKSSLNALLKHLRSANIQDIQMEYHQKGKFIGGDLEGYIDMLLTDPEGKQVVLDIKWSGKKFRREELTNNTHLQLALYAYLREEETGTLPADAFFIIDEATLLAQTAKIFPDAETCSTTSPDVGTKALFEKFTKTWEWRRKQLDQGLIEVTIEGTTPDELSNPSQGCVDIPDSSDRFNDFAGLTGWV